MRAPAGQVNMRSQPRAPLPTVDPRATDADRWYGASGFELVTAPGSQGCLSAQSEAAMARAAAITLEANEAAKQGDDNGKVRAAGLHAMAAELRREAGAWSACIENFTALVEHYLEIGDAVTAEAYVQKLRFVSDHAQDEVTMAEAALTAMSAYIELGKPESALAMGKLARAMSGQPFGDDLYKRLAELTAKEETLRITNGGDWESRRARIPDEFRVRAIALAPNDLPTTGGPWLSKARAGIELLMEQPGAGGECRYWVTHRVTDGTHRICTLPNWSGRAMGAAKFMLEVSEADKNGTDGPSSAILQVTSALEAFINAVVHFIRQSGNESWDKLPLPGYCQPEKVPRRSGVAPCKQWRAIGKTLFGKGWVKESYLNDMTTLFRLRNCLVHYNWEQEETLYQNKPHWLISEFKSKEVEVRPEPAPWIDRLLTPSMASWAIGHAEMMISEFRKAWAAELVNGELATRWEAIKDAVAQADADVLFEAEEHDVDTGERGPIIEPCNPNGADQGPDFRRAEAGQGLQSLAVRRSYSFDPGQYESPV